MKKALVFLGFVFVTSFLISSCSSKPSECACQKAMLSVAVSSSPDWTTINKCMKAYKGENSCVQDNLSYNSGVADAALRSADCFNCN